MAEKPAVHELDHSGMPFFLRRDETFPVALAAQNNFVCFEGDDAGSSIREIAEIRTYVRETRRG